MRTGRMNWLGLVAIGGAVAGYVLAFAGSASASTTIGYNNNGTNCGPGTTFVQTGTRTGVPSYVVPAGGGVITSWSFLAGSNAGEQDKLKVLRPTGTANQFLVVGESALESMTASTLNTFPVRIPVNAGDRLGLFTADGKDCDFFSGSSSDAYAFTAADPAPGTTYTGTPGTTVELNVSATLVGPPMSWASVPGCPGGGPVAGTVTADSGTTPKAFHYKVDGGPEQVAPTTGNPGTASITLPPGVHSLEFWGEDELGQQEATHHTTSAGCPLTAAHVSNATESHAVFSDSSSPKLVTSARTQRQVGTTFKYALDKAAAVRFYFTQPGQGRTVRGRCVARTNHNKRKPRCAVVRGSLSFQGHAGQNAVRFYGWLSKHKRLKPGTYTLVITATTPGAGSTSQKLKFTIVR